MDDGVLVSRTVLKTLVDECFDVLKCNEDALGRDELEPLIAAANAGLLALNRPAVALEGAGTIPMPPLPKAPYRLIKTESSFCAGCDGNVTLLSNGLHPNDAAFFICFKCEEVGHVGVGKVAKGED